MSSNFPSSKEVTKAFLRFRDFLNQSWSSVDAILVDHDWDDDAYLIDDWFDANWRYLFVRQVLGKEENFQPLSVGTNELKKNQYYCRLHVEAPKEGIFVCIGTVDNGFSTKAPFDQVQMIDKDGELHIVPLSLVKFAIKK